MTKITWKNRITGYGTEAPDQLLANPHNHRIHPRRQQDALSGSLDTLGYIQTVIVNRTTSRIIDGHLRVSMALREGQAEIPVTYVELTEAEEAQALLSLDPIAAMAASDADKVDELLRMIQTDDERVMQHLADLAKENGLDYGQPEQGDAEPQIDRAAELLEKWGVKLGDCFEIGPHRLVCGDCTDKATVEKVLNGERVDCVMTDPPYGMNLNTDYSDMPETRIASKTYERVKGDDKDFDAAPFIAMFDYVKEQFYWGGDYFYTTLPIGGSWIVWDKRNENSDGLVGNHFEVCWSRTSHRRRMIRVHWSGVNARNQGTKREHPTEKSVKVLTEILSDYTKENALVVDIFAGVGTTLAACQEIGRRARCIELDPAYVAVALERMSQAFPTLEIRRLGDSSR